MDALSHILKKKIVAIIRGADPDDVLRIAHALYEGGVQLIEVTLNSKNAIPVIQDLSQEMEGRMLVGAGTVIDAAMTHQALDAGARFIISPILDTAVIEVTKKRKAVSIPGAFTPTEIFRAFQAGGDIIKVFPASANVRYIKEVRAPLPHIPLMPTGGVDVENLGEFIKAGAAAFGIGTALVDTKPPLTAERLRGITEKARIFMAMVEGDMNPST